MGPGAGLVGTGAWIGGVGLACALGCRAPVGTHVIGRSRAGETPQKKARNQQAQKNCTDQKMLFHNQIPPFPEPLLDKYSLLMGRNIGKLEKCSMSMLH
jgi:hypothetical protein